VKLLDRYLVREIIPPLAVGLILLTFALMMPPFLLNFEKLVEKGVDWITILRVLWTLAPQALCITIPMALLLGILVGLGRLSADREFVALQACGVSVFRVLRPIVLLAILAVAATAYEIIVALPDANQTFREVTFNIVAASAESDIKPRVFFTDFPNRVIYVRDIRPGAGWVDVFLADDTKGDRSTVYFAKSGRLVIDRARRRVELALTRGEWHTTYPGRPEAYESGSFESTSLNMDADTVFPRTQIVKGDNEMTIAELRATIAENRRRGFPSYSQQFTIQQKFSLPAACLVLTLIGVALGVNNRREGKLATMALGVGVVFVYYVLLYSSRAAALGGGRLSPTLAPWVANILLGAAGVALVLWRARASDRPIRINFPRLWGREPARPSTDASAPARRPGNVVLVIRVPHIHWPRPNLLDLYVSRLYLAVFGVAFAALVGIFYISTFIDLADKLFRGTATTRMLLRFFYFQTPQYVYYIVPLSGLVATLVTIGVLTKNSELIVMRACGISLYRSALPLVVFSAIFSVAMYELQERVLPGANRKAKQIEAVIRGWPTQAVGYLNRRWVVGSGGDIYHYEFFDPVSNHFGRMSLFHVDPKSWTLGTLISAQDVLQPQTTPGAAAAWTASNGWRREFTTARNGPVVRYTHFRTERVTLDPPSYFKQGDDPSDADRMTYAQLKGYIAQLTASGYHAVPYAVQLQKKIAFPLVTVIMTLLAVPFAVTTGKRGALSGIGIGIVIAILYRIAMSLFAALGAGGWLSPTLGAWAPNILFAAVALYMVLTVRT